MTRLLRGNFDEHVTYEAFLHAHMRASLNKGLRFEVLRFNLNRDRNLFCIMDIVGSSGYCPSNYWKFWVYDPKKRLILALPYPDRIVHQWYVEEFIKPYYIPRFIADSYACIPKRGTHAAVDKIQHYMRHMNQITDGHYYILKMDISKFFNSIDLRILFNILEKVIDNHKLLDLTSTILFEDGEHDGLPIGNYVSQYFANIYLNELDQYCKHNLGIKCYVRYMDDFIALAPDKETARRWFSDIEEFVHDQLNLKLNCKSCYYPGSQGLDFVGYRIHNDYRLIRKRSKYKLAMIIDDFENKIDEQDRFVQRVNAWAGHAGHADTYRLVQRRLVQYSQILPTVFPPDKDPASGDAESSLH